jgi:hypothetical protein
MNYPALKAAAMYLIDNGVEIPSDLLSQFASLGIKSQEYYQAQLTRLVKSFYKGNMDILEFVTIFGDLITGQLTKAWNEGMEVNGVPPEDITDEWKSMLDDIIATEKDSIMGFADEIAAASGLTDQPIDPYLSRVDIWANRYPDVVNQAILATAEEKTKLEWVYGDTDHCDTCLQLNGIVAYAREWEEAGLHPQQPPNGALACGGWRCACALVPTTARRRRASELMDIATSAGI